MTDAVSATGAALFAALSTATLTFYQHVPQDTVPPVGVIGEHRVTAPFGKGDPDRSIEIDIIVIYQGEQNKPVIAWQAEIIDKLDGKTLSASGFRICPTILSETCQLDDDGITYVGTSKFKILALAE